MPSPSSGPKKRLEDVSGLRLDSWKDIAAYLGRGERTVKRWERDRSLPVHRLPGGGKGSVYAFTAELDVWLISANSETLANPNDETLAEAGDETASGSAIFPSPPESLLESMNRLEQSVANPERGWSWQTKAFLFLSCGLLLAVAFLFSIGAHGVHAPALLRAWLSKPRRAPSDAEKKLASELYLQGRYEWNKRTPDSLNRALDDFTQGLVHDPGNAQIYVGLADTYLLLREYSAMPNAEAYSRAITAARKAIELDDSLAEAHRSLAFAEVWGNWDFVAGEREFRRAIELNPRDPIAHLWFANAYAAPGWYALCLREIDRAQELDPTSPAILSDKGNMLVQAGETQQGMEVLKQVERTDPEFLSPHRYLAGIYMIQRDYSDFLMESEKAAHLSGDSNLKTTTDAAREGYRRDGARGLLQELYVVQRKLYDAGKVPGTDLAKTCILIGKKEEALQLLEADYRMHRDEFVDLRADKILAELKDEPEYKDLLAKLHLPVPDSTANARFMNADSLRAAMDRQ